MFVDTLLQLTLARLRNFARQPSTLFWVFGFPLLLTVALGLAFRDSGPAKFTVALIDEGQSTPAWARETLLKDPSLVVQVVSAAAASAAARTGQIVLRLQVTHDEVHYLYDPSRPGATEARAHAEEALQAAAGRQNALRSSDETFVTPGGRYIDWLVPGLIGFQLLNGSMWGVGLAIADMRQKKLLKRLVATPMPRPAFLLSWVISGLMIMPFQVGVLLLFGRLAFSVVPHGSIVLSFVVAGLGSVSFTGLGLLCAGRAKNVETANGLINLAILPMAMLSGVFFSPVNFPAWMQPVIHALPLSALNEALRLVVNEGAGLFAVGPQLLTLLAWSLGGYLVAIRTFRWT